MHEKIAKLKTVENCETFEANALKQQRLDLATAARKRALELKAKEHGAATDVERKCLEAIYAYERILSEKNGKKTKASRTWQMINRHGIIEAVERAVNRPVETVGYKALVDMGLENYAFEAVVVQNPELFSADAVKRCQERINEWGES